MDKKENGFAPTSTDPTAPSAKQQIATMAGKLARNAPNADLELFYTAIAAEFQRQVDFDQARAATTIANPPLASSLGPWKSTTEPTK